MGSWIDYIREVGGRYILKFSKDGVSDTKTSEDDTAKAYIKRKKTEKFDDDEMRNIRDKMTMNAQTRKQR